LALRSGARLAIRITHLCPRTDVRGSPRHSHRVPRTPHRDRMSLPRFSVENPVLVNMMMLVTLVAGSAFAFTLVREMFPESRPNAIAITAIYPAVQPEELEKAITIKVEEAVRDIEGI